MEEKEANERKLYDLKIDILVLEKILAQKKNRRDELERIAEMLENFEPNTDLPKI